ncbi:MAG: hypothetical protein ACFFD4_09675 [Candidatus Odinarchaeota archaeon]
MLAIALSSQPAVQRTFTLGVTGLLPQDLLQDLPVELVSRARRLVAKTVGRQVRNYGYQLAGLGYEMCNTLASSSSEPPLPATGEEPSPPLASFKYTALRKTFGSSANFTNNAYFLVSNAMAARQELQNMREQLWQVLQQPDMAGSLETFLFTGFSQRYLLSRLEWPSWPWARQFIRAARNQLDPELPVVLQRAPVPAWMATTSQVLTAWLGLATTSGTSTVQEEQPPDRLVPVQVQQVLNTAVKHSLLPFLWSPGPLPRGLFPRDSEEAAEQLRQHVYHRLRDPDEQAKLFSQVPLRPVLVAVEDVERAIMIINQRVQEAIESLTVQGRDPATLRTFQRKLGILQTTPAALELLAEVAWFPQTRLVLRIAQALTVLTGRKRLVSAVAAIAAHLVVNRAFNGERGVTGETVPVELPMAVPQLAVPFHSSSYRLHPVAFPLLENKYTFQYPACDSLTPALRHRITAIEIASNPAVPALERHGTLGKAVKAGERPVFSRSLDRTRPYLIDELPWAVTGPAIQLDVSRLQQYPAFCRYLETGPACRVDLPPRLLHKLHRGAVLKQITLVPPRSPTGLPTCRLTLEGTLYQLYHRQAGITSPRVPRPGPGDLPDFPRVPVGEASLSILEQFNIPSTAPGTGHSANPLPRLVKLQVQDLLASSCLALDVNRLGSDWALIFGGWCHGQFYPLAPGYQEALNGQFQRWARDIDVLEIEIARLSRKLARYRNKGHPVTSDWYRRRTKELGCLHAEKHGLKQAAYQQAAESIYTVIEATRPAYFFYEDLKGLSPRGKKGSFARLLTWMLTRIASVIQLVETWCHTSGIPTSFHELDARKTSTFHVHCGGRLLRGPGQWDHAPCQRCGELVNTHENAAFTLIKRGLMRFLDVILAGLPVPEDPPPL